MNNQPDIPDGYRLATQKDKFLPKPPKAMWWNATETEWNPVNIIQTDKTETLYSWIKENIYIVPLSWNKEQNSTPIPPDGYRLATAEDMKLSKTQYVKHYKQSVGLWVFSDRHPDWNPNIIYAVPNNWNKKEK